MKGFGHGAQADLMDKHVDSDEGSKTQIVSHQCVWSLDDSIFIDVLKLLLRGLCRFFPGFDIL